MEEPKKHKEEESTIDKNEKVFAFNTESGELHQKNKSELSPFDINVQKVVNDAFF